MLTELQERTWRILAAVPEADGFALAGGSALILTGVVQRGSNDLDVFGTYPGSAIPFAEAAQRGLTSEGLNPTVERWGEGFVRMRVTDGADTTWVDIAIDVRRHPTVADPTGPVLNIRELAADKMLALGLMRMLVWCSSVVGRCLWWACRLLGGRGLVGCV